jgi:hypothetical protein
VLEVKFWYWPMNIANLKVVHPKHFTGMEDEYLARAFAVERESTS